MRYRGMPLYEDLKGFVERNFPELTVYTEAVRQPFVVI